MLAADLLAYDDLRNGRLMTPVPLALPSGRGYHLVCPKRERRRHAVEAFYKWMQAEVAMLDWSFQRRTDAAPSFRGKPKKTKLPVSRK